MASTNNPGVGSERISILRPGYCTYREPCCALVPALGVFPLLGGLWNQHGHQMRFQLPRPCSSSSIRHLIPLGAAQVCRVAPLPVDEVSTLIQAGTGRYLKPGAAERAQNGLAFAFCFQLGLSLHVDAQTCQGNPTRRSLVDVLYLGTCRRAFRVPMAFKVEVQSLVVAL